MPSWPNTLPDVSWTLSAEPEPVVIRTEMSSLRVRQRPRFTVTRMRQNVKWLLTGEQYAQFQTFVRRTLGNGSAFFSVDLPFGSGLETVQARFVSGSYKVAHVDPYWQITAVLEVINPPTMSEEDYDYYVTLGFDLDTLEEQADALHDLVNQALPARFY